MVVAYSSSVDALAVAAVALAAISTVFLIVLVVRRVLLARALRRQAEIEERLRPLVLRLLDEDEELPGFDIAEAEADVIARLLGRYGRQVRGASGERLSRWLSASGALQRTREQLRARASWRRALAAYALGDMASQSSVGGLLHALDDPSRDVRAAAARSLGRLGAVDAVRPLLLAQSDGRLPRTIVGQALLAIGVPAVPALLELMDADDAATRAGAVELVGLIGSAAEGAAVVGALRDAAAEVRAQAARALGRLGDDEAAAALRAALDDRIEFVRAAAAEALGEISDDEAVEPLLRMAERDGFEAARAAAYAVVRIDPSANGSGPFLAEAKDMAAL